VCFTCELSQYHGVSPAFRMDELKSLMGVEFDCFARLASNVSRNGCAGSFGFANVLGTIQICIHGVFGKVWVLEATLHIHAHSLINGHVVAAHDGMDFGNLFLGEFHDVSLAG